MQEVFSSEDAQQKTILGRIRALIAALVSHFPLTGQGSLALILSAGALRLFGYGSMDLVVFALCLCALFVVITSLFATVIGGLIVQRRVIRALQNQSTSRSGYASFEAGHFNSTDFSLVAVRGLPLIRINWQIVSPANIETLNEHRRDNRLHETIIPARRGKSASITRRFEVRDALGFCSYSWLATQPFPHRTLPRIGAYKAITLQRARVMEDGLPDNGGRPDGDRMEIRPYTPGDSVRDIMWKGFARNRQLNVRLPERSVAFDDKACAYLVSGVGDEAASALARLTLECGLLGDDWRFGADTPSPTGTLEYRSLEDALDAISASAMTDESRFNNRTSDSESYYGLDRFIAATRCTQCLVFASARDSAVLNKLAATAHSGSCRLNLVVGVDVLGRHTPSASWQKALWQESRSAPKSPKLSSTSDLTALSQCVESIVLVDRTSGDLLKISDLEDAILG